MLSCKSLYDRCARPLNASFSKIKRCATRLLSFQIDVSVFTVLKWPQSPDLNSMKHLWDTEDHFVMVLPTNEQQLCDATASKWSRVSQEGLKDLGESLPRARRGSSKI